jgi:hypothetical protein
MDTILDRIVWPLCTIIIAAIFFVIFKDKLRYIDFDPRNRRFKAMFKQNVNKAKSQAKNIKKTVAASGLVAIPGKAVESGKQTARDIVIGAFGALKQAVYSACMTSGIPLTPSTGIPTAAKRLLKLHAIDGEVNDLIGLLHRLGEDLFQSTGLLPSEEDARTYEELANIQIDWLMLNVRPANAAAKPSSGEKVPDRERTRVGEGYRLSPSAGRPTTYLIGTNGSVQGMQVPIERSPFTIGANAASDLRISGDEFVSGSHAEIRFEEGSLFLVDRNSSNGTYLNGKRIRNEAVSIQQGDQLRIGESVFRVSDAPKAA